MSSKKTDAQPKKVLALDDESRVKILSPGRLVIKRFFRNRLAIVGLAIVVSMFLFSFVGGVLSPYGESQTFFTYDLMLKNYASAAVNTNLYYTNPEGQSFGSTQQAAFVLARNNNNPTFESGGNQYTWVQEGEEFYRIIKMDEIATAMVRGGAALVAPSNDFELSEDLRSTLADAVSTGKTSVEVDGVEYQIANNGKSYSITVNQDVAIASLNIFHPYDAGTVVDYDFQYASQLAINSGASSFTADDVTYDLSTEDGITTISLDGEPYVSVNNLIVTPASTDVFLSVDFKNHIAQAIADNVRTAEFEYPDLETGEMVTYEVERKDYQFYVRTETETQLIDLYAAPSAEHWLGTDGNGMDILTRLMYGGRVSLIIGFIVVLIELAIGVVIGGVSGYFGKWVDQILMRFVDIIICIPTMPLYIILGAMMDNLKMDSGMRIYYLILVFGLLGWVGIARVVRGQILSLREQEFMTAAEATGLSIPRRIFKHLVPNVVPQLIVYASMGLGSIILSEATLSFLGLGVKFPYASWGNIVNAVNDSHVLTNYWFVWIPAGFLILITVLGYNFVGDGLRDAFDPKMKR